MRYNRADWAEALAHYQQLEKVAVLKRHFEARIASCSRELVDEERSAYVDPILAIRKPQWTLRAARYNRALLLLDRTPADAKADLEWLVQDGIHAEESTHHLAAIQLAEGNATGCQVAVFAQLNQYGGGSEWAYRSFLLLAESYLAQGDLFQARTTIEQLQANVSEPWVQDACLDFQDRLLQLENPPPMPDLDSNFTEAPITPESTEE